MTTPLGSGRLTLVRLPPRPATSTPAALLLALTIGLAPGCSGGTAGPASLGSPRPGSATPAESAACRSISTPPPAPSGPTSPLPLWTLAKGLDQPDDLLFHDGSLLIGILGSGRIEVLAPGRPATRLPVVIPSVEGLAYLGGTLYAAGQAQDVVEAVRGDRLATVIQLRPVAGQDGVDGIGVQGNLLVVPDSPRGAVYWVDPVTRRIVKSVSGFTRPTGVWGEPDGSLLVADEFGDAAIRVAADGTRTDLVRGLPVVDDVAADAAGAVFVVTPASSGGRLVRLVGGRAVDVVDGLAAPQGLALDGAGNLLFSESGAGRVDLAIRSFKLVPLGAVADSATRPVCVDLVRGPGERAAITLAAGPGVKVVTQPGTGDRGAVLVTGCREAPCRMTARAGAGTVDSMAIVAKP